MAMYPCLSLPSLSFPTLTGSIVTFNSQYAGLPLKSHKIALTATQSGSGTPSPDNPRPITGYSAINISHSDADTSNPTVYTIQIGSTVYGGEYDARTGVLMVTHGFTTFDGSADENWTNVLGAFNIIISDAEQIQTPICNLFNALSSRVIGYLNDNECAFTPSGAKNLNFKYSSAADLTEWKSFLSDNNIQVCYELATPTTIQLPPCPINARFGLNNIFADCGSTALEAIKIGR